MKFIAEIENNNFTLDVRREGERVIASIDGRPYTLSLREVSANVLLLLDAANRVYECRIDASPDGATSVHLGNRAYSFQLTDAKRLRRTATSTEAHGGQSKIIAPMPGKIVRLLVEPGSQVEAGDALIVVEAMKMQNEMKAARAGRIAAVNTQAGATVSAGDVLIVIE